MVFSSLIFLYIFLPLCVLMYFLFPQIKVKNAVLILFSLIFYAWGEPIYILLMIFTSFVNYIFGRILGRCEDPTRRKWLLALCVVIDLSALVYFKYAGFFVDIINGIFSISIPFPKVVMPIGISFFTFQALSYTVDVYRKDVGIQRSFWRFLMYVSMFPQLIAGPIVRYSEIETQIEQRHTSMEDAFYGAFRFFVGLGKKVLLANYAGKAASLLLDINLASATVAGTWFGMLMFALEIYFDFSGYSDMAIGMGRIFGFRFNENFNLPYISNSITDFWRRWHISLSSFFRDYVYIPLGGNRKHQIFNLFVVWSLTGFWHGANWNFILWGLYFFVLLVIEKSLRKVLEKIPNAIKIPVTLFFVLLGWTLFYFTDLNRLVQVLSIMFGFGGVSAYTETVGITMMNNLLLLAVCVIGCTPLPRLLGKGYMHLCHPEQGSGSQTVKVIGAVLVFLFNLAVLFMTTASLAGSSYNPFLYFRF